MKNLKVILGAGFAFAMICACTNVNDASKLTASGLNPAAFDTTINDKVVKLYTLKNSKGMEAT